MIATQNLISASSRVLILEDHEMVAMALKMILKDHFPVRNGNAREVIHLSSIEAARALIGGEPGNIDVLLLDLALDDAGSSECIQLLTHEWRSIPTIVVTGETDPEIADDLIQAGVVGIIPKTAGLKVIGLALQLIDAGGTYYPGHAHRDGAAERRCAPRSPQDLDAPASESTPDASRYHLPPQLSKTLNLLECGLSNKEIAKTLNVSVGTAKNYVSATLAKLGMSRRLQLLAKKGPARR